MDLRPEEPPSPTAHFAGGPPSPAQRERGKNSEATLPASGPPPGPNATKQQNQHHTSNQPGQQAHRPLSCSFRLGISRSPSLLLRLLALRIGRFVSLLIHPDLGNAGRIRRLRLLRTPRRVAQGSPRSLDSVFRTSSSDPGWAFPGPAVMRAATCHWQVGRASPSKGTNRSGSPLRGIAVGVTALQTPSMSRKTEIS